MTRLLFQDALLDCCASEMGKYHLENKKPFTNLLLVPNAPGCPPFIGDHPDIRVVFLPPNTTSLIYLDQVVVAAFMTCYPRRTFDLVITAPEKGLRDSDAVLNHSDNIYDCVKTLAWACGDVTEECMSGPWKATLKRFIRP